MVGGSTRNSSTVQPKGEERLANLDEAAVRTTRRVVGNPDKRGPNRAPRSRACACMPLQVSNEALVTNFQTLDRLGLRRQCSKIR